MPPSCRSPGRKPDSTQANAARGGPFEALHRAAARAVLAADPAGEAGAVDKAEQIGVAHLAVIGLAVSHLLFERYPDEDEGFLTARRAALVNREALAVMALELGLDRQLLLGRGEADAGGASRPSVLAGAFEALAGALSLTEGHDRTEAVLER